MLVVVDASEKLITSVFTVEMATFEIILHRRHRRARNNFSLHVFNYMQSCRPAGVVSDALLNFGGRALALLLKVVTSDKRGFMPALPKYKIRNATEWNFEELGMKSDYLLMFDF